MRQVVLVLRLVLFKFNLKFLTVTACQILSSKRVSYVQSYILDYLRVDALASLFKLRRSNRRS